jgi:hypothetical protein
MRAIPADFEHKHPVLFRTIDRKGKRVIFENRIVENILLPQTI